MSDKLKAINDIIDGAPEGLAVLPVPALPVFADNFVFTATIPKARLQEVIATGLPIMLAPQRDRTTENPKASDLYAVGLKASVLRQQPQPDGNVSVVFETGDSVRARYSDANGYIAGVVTQDDWEI